MSYDCKILADSINDRGHRLTTFEVTFPRFILAEVNTHRMLSRNSASSRAIPTERLIEEVRSFPFIPDFNRRVQGMGVGEPLTPIEQADRVMSWDRSREAALTSAKEMLDLDKSRVNRLLEPFMWHTAILSGTDWLNFFGLRTDPNAQPEFRTVALMMREAYQENEPRELSSGEWHLPLVTDEEINDEALQYADPWIDWEMWKKISIGRCARVSYLTHDGKRDLEADVALAERLRTNGHLSPYEHVARPFSSKEWDVIHSLQEDIAISYNTGFNDVSFLERLSCGLGYCGNYYGWFQARYEVPNQDDFSKVIENAVHNS